MVYALICMHMTPKSMGSCHPSATLELQNSIDDVARWMRSNGLQLNTLKTGVFWSTPSRRLHLLPVSPIHVGSDQVKSVSVVHSLGVYIDADVLMRSHVTKTVGACFAILCQLPSICLSVPHSILRPLVSSRPAAVSNSGLCLIKLTQSVVNSAAWLVFSASRYDRITPLFTQLHWLKVPERIKFKLAVLVYRCPHRTGLPYLIEEFHQSSAVEACKHLRSALTSFNVNVKLGLGSP